jgi:hypothetical protein
VVNLFTLAETAPSCISRGPERLGAHTNDTAELFVQLYSG